MDDPTTTGITEGFGLMFYNARWYDPYLNHFTQPDSIVPASQGVQGLNRYAYVNNNPLRYTDPTGHMMDEGTGGGGGGLPLPNPPDDPGDYCDSHPSACGGGGGGGGGNNGGCTTLCNPSIIIDSGICGSGGYYSPHCSGWHYYRVENIVCLAVFRCTEEDMIDYMLRFAFPNQDPSKPAVDGMKYTVGIPIMGYDLDQMGAIRFTTSNGGLTTMNTTLENHILFDGLVERTAVQNANGDWVVITEGYGNNVNPGMDIANAVGGPMLFETVDAQMISYVAIHQVFGP